MAGAGLTGAAGMAADAAHAAALEREGDCEAGSARRCRRPGSSSALAHAVRWRRGGALLAVVAAAAGLLALAPAAHSPHAFLLQDDTSVGRGRVCARVCVCVRVCVPVRACEIFCGRVCVFWESVRAQEVHAWRSRRRRVRECVLARLAERACGGGAREHARAYPSVQHYNACIRRAHMHRRRVLVCLRSCCPACRAGTGLLARPGALAVLACACLPQER